MLTLARDLFENGLSSLLPLEDFKNTRPEEAEPNFYQEPKKAKRQLKRLLEAVAQHIRPREVIINEARLQSDVNFVAPDVAKSSVDEQTAQSALSLFRSKTSIIYDVASMLDLLAEEDIVAGKGALNATALSHLLYLSLAFLFE